MRSMKLLAGALAGMCLVSANTVSLFASAEQSDSNISTVIEKILGDPSGDGVVNAVDASYILKMYSDYSINLGEITDELLAVCDVNKDGSVNAMDASYVLSYYADQALSDEVISLEEYIASILDSIDWDDLAEKFKLPDDEGIWDPASSLSPDYQIDPDADWTAWLPEGFLDEESPWTWTGEDSNPFGNAAANPWYLWDPASSLSPDYQIDPDRDWTAGLPEGFLDEESPWTWTGESTSPWGNIPSNAWNPDAANDQWDEWYKNIPTENIDNWLQNTLDMLNEIEEPADTE